MRRRNIIGVICLALLAFTPLALNAQAGGDASPRDQDAGFELSQNYPNPFNPSTRIPFRLDPVLFEGEEPVRVTMRIFNVLAELVAYPTALNHPDGDGTEVRGLEYTTPGPKEAFWDGRDQHGRQVASGLYYLQMIVGGERRTMPMIVSK